MSLPPGEHILLGERITVKKSCSPHHFLSRNTGHELVKGYREFDFRFWYDQEKDMITPIADTTLRCDFMRPILLCGGDDRWEYAAAEMTCGKGRVIVCQAILESYKNRCVILFANAQIQRFILKSQKGDSNIDKLKYNKDNAPFNSRF
jgi:hypothetical protein